MYESGGGGGGSFMYESGMHSILHCILWLNDIGYVIMHPHYKCKQIARAWYKIASYIC